jgi:hypothetical protein
MTTTPTAAMETLLGLTLLQLVAEKEARRAAYRLHCSNHLKKSDWGHSDIFKMATEAFSGSMALSDNILPLEAFDRKYLVEYPSMEICNLQKRAVDLRLVFNETSIMECILGSISSPSVDVVYNFTHS